MGESKTEAPASILIIGTGVFGLSTADSLISNLAYAQTEITLIDAYVPPPPPPAGGSDASTNGNDNDDTAVSSSPSGADVEANASALTASLDSSRIIRTDYANLAYAQLASAAQVHWRSEWPFATQLDGKAPATVQLYHQVGLICSGCESEASNSNARGRSYIEASLKNVQTLQPSAGSAEQLDGRAAIRTALRGDTGAHKGTNEEGQDDDALGDFGYINRRSGWADASGAMAAIRARVRMRALEREKECGGKLHWQHGRVERLLFEDAPDGGSRVVGARLQDGSAMRAAITIVAAGAWSPLLLPRTLGPRLHAAGQPLSYIPLSEHERKQLAGRPVLLNHGTALFVIPPPPDGAAQGGMASVLKAAQHGWGYARTVRVEDTEPGAKSGATVQVSVPPSTTQPIPPRSMRELRAFLKNLLPEIAADKEFSGTRLCWYADTASGDFLIDFVPAYGRSCLVVSGGSGHGFKFLPVLGKYVVERLEGRLGSDDLEAEGKPNQQQNKEEEVEEKGPELPSLDEMVGPEVGEDRGALGKKLAHLWRWRTEEELVEDRKNPGDGSRGGVKGLIWEDEMREVDGWTPHDEGQDLTGESAKRKRDVVDA